MCNQSPGYLETFDFCQLIDYLIQDLKHLEVEVVKTRFELSQYLPAPHDESLRSDILSDLAGRYGDHPAYQRYIELMHDNIDPLDDTEWVKCITDAVHGIDRS